MSIRIAIAKWLAPEVFDQQVILSKWLRSTTDQRERYAARVGHLSMALNNIVAQRTPKCAHAAKRMADIAAQALTTGEG
jgi:hypothetical protein